MTAKSPSSEPGYCEPETVIPVANEELVVGKRTLDRGRVRMTKNVREREELVEQPLLHDEIDIEHVPINRVIDAPMDSRFEGDVLVIPVIEETLVVKKQLVLKEELRVRKRQVETVHKERVALRTEEIAIERSKDAEKGER